MSERTFTGRQRVRTTRWTVRVAERIARGLITVGGLATIVSVLFVFVFLAWVVIPLFQRTELAPGPVAVLAETPHVEHLAINESQTLGWLLGRDGTLRVFRADDGTTLEQRRLFNQGAPTAMTIDAATGGAAFGFADGRVQLGRFGFSSIFVQAPELPPELQKLALGQRVRFEHGIAERVNADQFIVHRMVATLDEPIAPEARSPVLLINQTVSGNGAVFAALTADGMLRTYGISERKNLLTNKITTTISGGQVALPRRAKNEPPTHALLSGVGDAVFVIWADGHLLRFDTRDFDNPVLAETVDLLPEAGATVTALRFLVGKSTLVVGDSSGNVRAWFAVKPAAAKTAGDIVFTMAKQLPPAPGTSVTWITASTRDRMIAAGYSDGRVRLFYVTSGLLLGEAEVAPGKPVESLALAPKDDAIYALGGGRLGRFAIHAEHPETTFATIFRPVWYEGYEGPEQVWQSSSGSDAFEPKFGLMPLIFGTIKATAYCMLFGVPLALLAALYTSEFLDPRTKARIKPTIELMASLPSVVLGFLAALVFAPLIEGIVTETLVFFFALPFVYLLGAHLWQLLPEGWRTRLAWMRLGILLLMFPVGVGLTMVLGPWYEGTFFGGDIKLWLDGHGAGATGGWLLMLLPFSTVLVLWFIVQWVNPALRRIAADWEMRKLALVDLAKFLAATAVSLGLAWAGAAVLQSFGFDPRGSIVGTYVQRNALIVGFVMGFAVIPIIYTLSEDALSSVPEHLRAGSLATGATPWQTAVRIIIPTAASGLFSAMMVGFGRAVGETMIVLMAAGNTPVMEWNIFNGFRTLSANIAVELPEAVRNSTHYRMLFLAALALFIMTFILNTVAEIVRQRFRKRAYQL